jgi:hypothetical protein
MVSIMPNDIITSNKVNITPLVNELVEYVKDKKTMGNIEEMVSKLPQKDSPDWKLISGVLCNSIVEWASQNNDNGGRELIQHIQSDIGYLLHRLGLTQ